jgi:hypothetical protein
MQDEPFFRWQERALGVLMAWGTANVVVGAGGTMLRDEAPRNIAYQAVAWGAIDLALAVAGRRGARRHARTATPDATAEAVRSFRRILLINALLDVGYIAGGSALATTAKRDRRRAGVGLGIVAQGVFLTVYDVTLLLLSERWNAPASL